MKDRALLIAMADQWSLSTQKMMDLAVGATLYKLGERTTEISVADMQAVSANFLVRRESMSNEHGQIEAWIFRLVPIDTAIDDLLTALDAPR